LEGRDKEDCGSKTSLGKKFTRNPHLYRKAEYGNPSYGGKQKLGPWSRLAPKKKV
jgi:hypothetical protein